MSSHVYAGLRVRDFEAARAWYERLLGAASFLPHATEAVWALADGGSVYVVQDANGAGRSVATLFVDDLDRQLAEIAGRGLAPDELETYGNGVRKATFRDPDGNAIGFGGPPEAPGLLESAVATYWSSLPVGVSEADVTAAWAAAASAVWKDEVHVIDDRASFLANSGQARMTVCECALVLGSGGTTTHFLTAVLEASLGLNLGWALHARTLDALHPGWPNPSFGDEAIRSLARQG